MECWSKYLALTWYSYGVFVNDRLLTFFSYTWWDNYGINSNDNWCSYLRNHPYIDLPDIIIYILPRDPCSITEMIYRYIDVKKWNTLSQKYNNRVGVENETHFSFFSLNCYSHVGVLRLNVSGLEMWLSS